MLAQANSGHIDEIIEAGDDEELKSIDLRGGGRFQQVPSNMPMVKPDLLYISGARGSGKSFYTAQYLKQFKIYYPTYRIYLLSQKPADDTLDKFISKRIDCSQVAEAQFTAKDFEKSLVIFDDVDTLPSTKSNNVKEAVYALMTDIIETCRSLGVFGIVTSHLVANSNESKRILNGCTSFTFFLATSTKQVKYALENYFGFDRKEIRKILAMKDTKFITVFREAPQVIMTSNDILFQSEL
jgi:hypothetical protein